MGLMKDDRRAGMLMESVAAREFRQSMMSNFPTVHRVSSWLRTSQKTEESRYILCEGSVFKSPTTSFRHSCRLCLQASTKESAWRPWSPFFNVSKETDITLTLAAC